MTAAPTGCFARCRCRCWVWREDAPFIRWEGEESLRSIDGPEAGAGTLDTEDGGDAGLAAVKCRFGTGVEGGYTLGVNSHSNECTWTGFNVPARVWSMQMRVAKTKMTRAMIREMLKTKVEEGKIMRE